VVTQRNDAFIRDTTFLLARATSVFFVLFARVVSVFTQQTKTSPGGAARRLSGTRAHSPALHDSSITTEQRRRVHYLRSKSPRHSQCSRQLKRARPQSIPRYGKTGVSIYRYIPGMGMGIPYPVYEPGSQSGNCFLCAFRHAS
jgi:hypothetical protein